MPRPIANMKIATTTSTVRSEIPARWIGCITSGTGRAVQRETTRRSGLAQLFREAGLLHERPVVCIVLFQELREIGARQEIFLQRIALHVLLPLRRADDLFHQIG